MATTENLYTGNGATVLYSFTFPYLSTADIKVSVNGTNTTAYTLANATTVQFNSAPANGAAIRIYRVSSDDTLEATFYPGSSIRAQDLNDNFTQNLYLTQEAVRDVGNANDTAADAVALANTAVSTANSADTKADTAIATANDAVATANSVETIANDAAADAAAALSTANDADNKATLALDTVAGTIQYVLINDVASIPGSPANGDAVQIADSTGIESFTPLTGLPGGFIGDSGLFIRIQYSGATWIYRGYGAVDPDDRYAGVNTNKGSAATPAIAFGPDDIDTGIYSPGANQLGLSTGGTSRLTINSTGGVSIPGTLGVTGAITGNVTGSASNNVLKAGDTMTGALGVPVGSAAAPAVYFDSDTGLYSPGADQVAISTGGTGRLWVTSGGGVLVGTGTTASAPNRGSTQIVPQIQLAGPGAGSSMASLSGYFTDTTYAPAITLCKSNNASVGSHTAVASNTALGELNFAGSNGSTFLTAAAITSFIDGAVSGGGANDMPGRLVFSTTPDGSATPVERLRITSDGKVGVGTGSPGENLSIAGAANVYASLATTGSIKNQIFASDAAGVAGLGSVTNHPLALYTNNTERARIDSSGRLLVGTSSSITAASFPAQIQSNAFYGYSSSLFSADNNGSNFYFLKSRNATTGSHTVVQANDLIGSINFAGSDGTVFANAASVAAVVDGTPGTNDMPGRLVFSTTSDGASSPTERMRIDATGNVLIRRTANTDTAALCVDQDASGGNVGISTITTSTATRYHLLFRNGNGQVGSISTSGSATTYSTSSDYRLKENVTPVTDGIARLQQLKPSRFNFIADPANTVDGFIAHEVQAIVPEAVTGEKDALDDEGNPQYQGIDQSKIVPLLTAALQEAITRIETLEAKVAAIESA